MKINAIISYLLISIWGLLILLGILTLLGPSWLVDLSNPGKVVEAISIKDAGDNYLKDNKFNEAIQQYKRALKIVPDLKSAIANLAVSYQKIGNFKNAIISLNHLLTLEPEYPGTIYYNLGEIYEKTNETNIALESYLKAASIAPFPETSYQKAGHIFMERKDWGNAITNFKLAIENRRSMENSYKGTLITYQKSYSDTTEDYKNIEKILVSINYDELNSKYDKNVFNQQLSNDFELAKTYNNVGFCLANQNNYKQAKSYIEIALKINPNYKEAQNNLIVINNMLDK